MLLDSLTNLSLAHAHPMHRPGSIHKKKKLNRPTRTFKAAPAQASDDYSMINQQSQWYVSRELREPSPGFIIIIHLEAVV